MTGKETARIHPTPSVSPPKSPLSPSRWNFLRRRHTEHTLVEGAASKGELSIVRKKELSRRWEGAFKPPSASMSSPNMGGSPTEFRRAPSSFQRVPSSADSRTRPRSFIEFYKVITRGDREAHPFVGKSVDPMGFSETAARLRDRLRKTNRYLVSPTSRRMQYYDLLMLLLLLYTATVTPYEICFLWEDSGYTALFYVNWIVNVCFMFDIGLQFCMPYRVGLKKGAFLVKSHKKIARHYLLGWFSIDLVSVIPVDTILINVRASLAGTGTITQSAVEVLRMVRMLRLLRLVKLFRILRASRIFARWEGVVTISYARRSLIKWMTIVFLLLHFLACALGLLAQFSGTQRTPDLIKAVDAAVERGYEPDTTPGDVCYGCVEDDPALASYCRSACLTPCELDLLARMSLKDNAYEAEVRAQRAQFTKSEMWVCRFNQLGVVPLPQWHGEVWVAAVYVSLVQLSGGVGSIYPENLPEYIVFIFGIMIGSVIWAMVVGTICAMMTTGDPHTTEYHQHMDALNEFLAENNVPEEVAQQARSYLRNNRELRKKTSYDDLMESLSPGLRGEIMLYLSKSTFACVWYLSAIEPECIVQIASHLTRHGYPPREKCTAVQLNIIVKGIAARSGDLLHVGDTWGDDIILTSSVLRDTRLTTTLTYVEVQSLTREHLYQTLEAFPDSSRSVQDAAVRMALKRTVVLLKAYADQQRTKEALATREAGEASGAGTGGDEDDGAGQSKAYEILTAAFSANAPVSPGAPDDVGMIFRMITGSKLRDLDEDGNIIEQVQRSVTSHQEAALQREMRAKLDLVKSDVQSVRSSVEGIERVVGQLALKAGVPMDATSNGGRVKFDTVTDL